MSTNETQVTIKGRLCADPSVFTTRAGTPMSKFRIASSSRRQVQPGQWEDSEPSFYDVLAYRSLAANIGVSLKKGHPVTVHGKQRVVQWRREDGQVFTNVEIEADAVGHDLTFGTTAYVRVGMGRAADAWSPGEGNGATAPGAPAQVAATGADPGWGGSSDGRPDHGGGSGPFGDPESDPYVVDGGLGRALGEVGVGAAGGAEAAPGEDEASTAAAADAGPLVRPGKEAAA